MQTVRAQAQQGGSRAPASSPMQGPAAYVLCCVRRHQWLQERHAEADLTGLRTCPPGSHWHHQLLSVLSSAQAGLNLCTALRASFERLYSSSATVTGLGSAPCTT